MLLWPRRRPKLGDYQAIRESLHSECAALVGFAGLLESHRAQAILLAERMAVSVHSGAIDFDDAVLQMNETVTEWARAAAPGGAA